MCIAYLDESNVGGLFTEALTADVESVLADQTSLVGADAAIHQNPSASSSSASPRSQPKTYQDRLPLPYVRGREYQTFS